MNATVTALPLQAAQTQGPDFGFFIMLAALGAIWFFLVLRPQQRRQKEHDASLKAAEKGDRVITAGGLHGEITSVKESTFVLDVAKLKGTAVHVEVEKSRIERVVKSGEQGAGDAKASESKAGKGGGGS